MQPGKSAAVRSGGGLGDARSGRRDEVLAVLRSAAGPLSIVEAADLIGVHPNTVRFHLDVLIDAGQIEQLPVAPAGRGRPPLRFRVRPGMDPTGRRNYLLLAEILTGDLAAHRDGRTRAIEAGRAWGRGILGSPTRPTGTDAITTLTALLADLGFSPEARSTADGRQIGLHHCPFLDLVGTRADIICPLHLGLMQGAMATLESPVTVQRLEPFVEPDLCLAHLSPDSADAAPPQPVNPSRRGDRR
ncbi:helix-turn-helix transcriptional regulator [Rhodococcus marinonascens]|uniref:helix-turn-helix transcriptional regulator n=1 Tax=Rhodococcus marinonascens TaxID=38311 RepID=UPI000934AA99|nr:helix-turn-helix domain-containing protein [Rhodococcus marinonascens]